MSFQRHRGCVVLVAFSALLVSPLVGCGSPTSKPGAAPHGHPPCAAGELTLSDGTCQAAGVPPEACAPGFSPDGARGCAAILPEQVCPPGQMATPGDKACRTVTPCGDGPWGAIPVDATTEFVDQAYPGNDSDGSRGRPWKTIHQGITAAAPGAIVAVADGRYPEDVIVADKPVRLWGRCPERVEVAGPGAMQAAVNVVRAGASGTEVHALGVTGPRAGILLLGARSVTLEGVWVHGAGSFGVGIAGSAGGVLRGALIEQNGGFGVSVQGAEATIASSAVRATAPDSAGRFGRGVEVDDDSVTGGRGTLSIAGSLIEQNQDIGVFVYGSDATISATVVRATQVNAAGTGMGVAVQNGPAAGQRGKLSMSASIVEQNHGFGVFVSGAAATINDTVVRANQPNSAGLIGRGIHVQPGANPPTRGTLSLTASLVDENHDVGITVGGSDATIEATVVRSTQLDGKGEFGVGLGLGPNPGNGDRGTLSLSASVIEQNHDAGVLIEGSDAVIEGTAVRGTQPIRAGNRGRGVVTQSSSDRGWRGKLTLSGSVIEQNHDIGVFVLDSDATISSTGVRGTQRATAGVELGDGILVMADRDRSNVDITNAETTDNDRAGVMYVGSTGVLSAVESSQNRFGLVLQPGMSGARPKLGAGNLIKRNTEQDDIVGGDLATPDAPSPFP